jgi:hypothetical protein
MECLIDAVQHEDVAYNAAAPLAAQSFPQCGPASHAENAVSFTNSNENQIVIGK